MLLTVVLVRGIRESAETNNVMVLLKIAAILAFVYRRACTSFIRRTTIPSRPNGWSGMLTGGSIIFFTYIGLAGVAPARRDGVRRRRGEHVAADAVRDGRPRDRGCRRRPGRRWSC